MLSEDELYGWVRDLPIVDWHNHLDPDMIAADRPLGSLYEVWVKADPYKHRVMRICGEDERVITGDGTEAEKWSAWMRTLPKLVGNPIFAWAQMELDFLGLDPAPYFHGCGENVSLASWTPAKMLQAFNVETICPCLSVTGVSATGATGVTGASATGATVTGATSVTGESGFSGEVKTIPSLRMNAGDRISEEALCRCEAAGCRVVDISVDDTAKLESEYDSLAAVAAFAAAHGWTMLLHLGALRETSSRLREAAGAAGGFAGMRAPVNPADVAKFLNRLESMRLTLWLDADGRDARRPSGADLPTGETPVAPVLGPADGRDARRPSNARRPSELRASSEARSTNALPRTILLTLNPEAHAQLAVLAGSFNGAGMPGKVQLGPAWWWCDHEEGIRDVLEKNAAYGVLSTFVGMTTDSRSLLSFVRHDYFRRILCKWTAEKIAGGKFPDDETLIRPILENICYWNSKEITS